MGVTPSHYRSAFWKFQVSAPARSILSKHNEQESKKTAHISRPHHSFPLRLRNERRNSILMTYHYPDLGRASDLSCRMKNLFFANQKPKGTKPTTAKLIELGEREIVSGKQAISFLRLTRIYFHYFWVVIFCSIFYTWQVAANCKHAKSNNTEYYRHCAGRQQFIAISKWWCLSPKVF